MSGNETVREELNKPGGVNYRLTVSAWLTMNALKNNGDEHGKKQNEPHHMAPRGDQA